MNRNYILFIETTWDRFTAAEEINDLYASGADGLFVTLKDEGPDQTWRPYNGRWRDWGVSTNRSLRKPWSWRTPV